jgi:phosphatidylinositol kinase/protein kinase (PI-3  family)
MFRTNIKKLFEKLEYKKEIYTLREMLRSFDHNTTLINKVIKISKKLRKTNKAYQMLL